MSPSRCMTFITWHLILVFKHVCCSLSGCLVFSHWSFCNNTVCVVQLIFLLSRCDKSLAMIVSTLFSTSKEVHRFEIDFVIDWYTRKHLLQRIVHTKVAILSLFSHHHVLPNPYNFLSSVAHSRLCTFKYATRVWHQLWESSDINPVCLWGYFGVFGAEKDGQLSVFLEGNRNVFRITWGWWINDDRLFILSTFLKNIKQIMNQHFLSALLSSLRPSFFCLVNLGLAETQKSR